MGPSLRFVEGDADEPRVLDVEGSEADRAFEALSAETARRILAAVYEAPATPAEISDEVGASLRDVHDHLERLEEADLVEPADGGAPESGDGTAVYGPTSEAVVLFAGRQRAGERLRNVGSRALGPSIALAAATIVLAVLLDQPETTGVGPEPALAFFLGGCVALAALAVRWYLRDVRPVR